MEISEQGNEPIIPYKTFLYVLGILILLTFTSVTLTRIYLGTLTVAIALVIAAVKCSFVLRIFMHLKFENRIFITLISVIVLLIFSVITLTLLDYIYR